MLNIVRLIPAIVSLLLLGAHFYRAGLPPLALVSAVLPLLLLLRAWWVARLFQVVLVLAALEWCRTLYMIAGMRMAFDMPWGRMALILGLVALLAAVGAMLFETRSLRNRYQPARVN